MGGLPKTPKPPYSGGRTKQGGRQKEIIAQLYHSKGITNAKHHQWPFHEKRTGKHMGKLNEKKKGERDSVLQKVVVQEMEYKHSPQGWIREKKKNSKAVRALGMSHEGGVRDLGNIKVTGGEKWGSELNLTVYGKTKGI